MNPEAKIILAAVLLETAVAPVDAKTVDTRALDFINNRDSIMLQQTEQQPFPTATVALGGANIRALPSTEAATIKPEGSISEFTVLGYVTENNKKWYYLGIPQGGFGWVRSDVVSDPVGPDVWDLTDVASIPMGAETPVPGETLINSNINLALVKAALSNSISSESVTSENIEVLSVQNQDVVFKLNNQINSFGEGTIIAVVGSNTELESSSIVIDPEVFISLLQSKGITTEGNFSGLNTPDTFLRFGENIIFNYENALSLKKQGKNDTEAFIQSVIFSDDPFPPSIFDVQSTTNGATLSFETNEMYSLSVDNIEGFKQATKLTAEQVDQLRSEPRQMTQEELGSYTSGVEIKVNGKTWQIVADTIPGYTISANGSDATILADRLKKIIDEDPDKYMYISDSFPTIKIAFTYRNGLTDHDPDILHYYTGFGYAISRPIQEPDKGTILAKIYFDDNFGPYLSAFGENLITANFNMAIYQELFYGHRTMANFDWSKDPIATFTLLNLFNVKTPEDAIAMQRGVGIIRN